MTNLATTAGSRQRKELGMARNHKTLKHNDDHLRRARETLDIRGTMALLWNVMRKSLPDVMISGYDDVLAELNLPRVQTGLDDQYEVRLGGDKYRFTTGDMAPPTALAAWNYARYEQLPHPPNHGVKSDFSYTDKHTRTATPTST